MKHVKKSTPEPTILTDYRTMNPTSSWEQLKSTNRECYIGIRDQLREDHGGLCAYCELSLDADNEQIAHFHPKSDTAGPQNWALIWENLWLTCKGGTQTWMSDPDRYLPPLPENISCDERKGSRILDGSILTPPEVPVFPRIFSFKQHPDRLEICPEEPACEEIGLDPNKVQHTIDAFNLNCPRLSEARLRLHRQLEQAIKKLRESGYRNLKEGFLRLAQRHLRKNDEGRWPAFFTLIRWRFKIHAEHHLRTIHFRG